MKLTNRNELRNIEINIIDLEKNFIVPWIPHIVLVIYTQFNYILPKLDIIKSNEIWDSRILLSDGLLAKIKHLEFRKMALFIVGVKTS